VKKFKKTRDQFSGRIGKHIVEQVESTIYSHLRGELLWKLDRRGEGYIIGRLFGFEPTKEQHNKAYNLLEEIK